MGVHATAVTASRSMLAAAGQLSMLTMATVTTVPGPIVPFLLVVTSKTDLYSGGDC